MEERALVIGKGSKEKRGPNTWRFRHNLGKDPQTGKYRYSPWRTIHTTKSREVDAAMEAYKAELNNGLYLRKSSDTIEKYANKFHLSRKGAITPLAYQREELDIKHINQLFAKIRIQELRSFMIEDAYSKVRRDETFSENELNKIHSKLRQILDHAVRDELIAKNPATAIQVPRPPAKERQALDAKEASRLRDILLKNPSAHTTCVLLMLDTGIRRGEALGLTWENISFEHREIFIVQQYANDKKIRRPKSAMAIRRLSISTWLVDYLKKWKTEQRMELERLHLSPSKNTPLVHILHFNDKIKAMEIGYMDPNNFNRWFRKFCVDNNFGSYEGIRKVRYVHRTINGEETRKAYNEAEWEELQTLLKAHPEIRRSEQIYVYKTESRPFGYKGLHPHMLRHTQATLLIAAGVDLKTVQARLGHESFKLTLDTYTHKMPSNDAKASDVFSAMLDEAKQ